MHWKFLFLKETFQSFINFRPTESRFPSGYVSSSWNQVWIIVTLPEKQARVFCLVCWVIYDWLSFRAVSDGGCQATTLFCRVPEKHELWLFLASPGMLFWLAHWALSALSARLALGAHTNMQARFWKFGLLLFMQNMHVLLYCAQSHK